MVEALNMSSVQRVFSPAAITVLTLLLVGACAAFVRLQYLPLLVEGDYRSYLVTAQYLAGEGEITHEVAFRMLKPLAPALISALSPIFGYQGATLFQAIVFYIALIIAMYLLAREFLWDRFLAASATLLVVLSYPVLKYGLDLLTETGGLFFYIISLWLTLKFIAKPSRHIFLWNAALITIGFLWKEYSIVAAVIFGLGILFHSALTSKQKAAYVAAYGAIFLAVHIPWQLYVDAVYDYSYFSWFKEGGAVGYASEYSLKNIAKSTAAVLGLAWLAVPSGLLRFRQLSSVQRRFLGAAVAPPFISYAWGYIASRLLYVLAPLFVLLAVEGIRSWRRAMQIAFIAAAILANFVWLFLSYSITL